LENSGPALAVSNRYNGKREVCGLRTRLRTQAGQHHLAPDEGSCRSRSRAPSAAGAERLLQLLRRSDQLPCPQRLLIPRALALAALLPAAKPATQAHVAEDDADRGALAAQPKTPALLSRLAVRRHDPGWEHGALAAHAGICVGVASNRRPYRDVPFQGLTGYIIDCVHCPRESWVVYCGGQRTSVSALSR
jgi:hypothetical protein